MGIIVEFNPDLALRNISEYDKGNRKIEECVPKNLEKDKIYPFLKEGQRNYFLKDEISLVETKGGEKISRSLASVKILEGTHFEEKGKLYTKGKYKVMEIFDDDEVHFSGFVKI